MENRSSFRNIAGILKIQKILFPSDVYIISIKFGRARMLRGEEEGGGGDYPVSKMYHGPIVYYVPAPNTRGH